MNFRAMIRVVRKRAGHRFRAGRSKVVQNVAPRGVREVSVDDLFREVGAISCRRIEMVHIGSGIELCNQIQILLQRRGSDEDIEGALRSGAHHLTPLGASAGLAMLACAVVAQHLLPVFLFQNMLYWPGGEKGTICRVLNTVYESVERHDVPLERLVFTQSRVVADYRALLSGLAEAEFYGRSGTNAREVDGAVSRARDSGHAGVEGIVENDAHVR